VENGSEKIGSERGELMSDEQGEKSVFCEFCPYNNGNSLQPTTQPPRSPPRKVGQPLIIYLPSPKGYINHMKSYLTLSTRKITRTPHSHYSNTGDTSPGSSPSSTRLSIRYHHPILSEPAPLSRTAIHHPIIS